MILTCRICNRKKDHIKFKKDNRRQFILTEGRRDICYECEYSSKLLYKPLDDNDPKLHSILKTCFCCDIEKPLFDFVKDWTVEYCRSNQCKECANRKARERRSSKKNLNPDYIDMKGWESSDHVRKYKYGMTKDIYIKMHSDQNGKCAICFKELDLYSRNTCIDHDHETGNIRGLLCGHCNTGIGFMKENILALQSSIEYLNFHNQRQSKGI